jgi:hypothetical protein
MAQSAVDHLNEQLTDVDTRSKALERDGMDAGRGVQGDMLKPSPSNNNMVSRLASQPLLNLQYATFNVPV